LEKYLITKIVIILRIIKVGNFVINAHMQSKPSRMSIFLKTQSLKSTFSHGLNFGLYKEKSI